MRKEHRPYLLYKVADAFIRLYIRHYLYPQFEKVGKHANFLKPKHFEICGPNVSIGDYFTAIARPDKPIRFNVWYDDGVTGEIRIGDYTIISPGVRIASASSVIIGDSCQIAEDCYITDADWHDVYHRILSIGETKPVCIENNVWLANRVTVCKGVHIGENSIVAADATVVNDVPSNTVVAGNPAKVVKELDPNHHRTTREDAYTAFGSYSEHSEQVLQKILKENTLFDWLRSWLLPGKNS